APSVWTGNKAWAATGNGVTVAVLDTGVDATHPDLGGGGNGASSRIQRVYVNAHTLGGGDSNGHGTHVVSILGARNPSGQYIGIAPNARIISVKIADDAGMAHESDLLRGLQWVYDNRASTGIKVVNLSITSGTAESYLTSPVAAAAEQLWFNGITVVVAAGNLGDAAGAVNYAPANDPFVITVGALDDNQTASPLDDSLAVFSS